MNMNYTAKDMYEMRRLLQKIYPFANNIETIVQNYIIANVGVHDLQLWLETNSDKIIYTKTEPELIQEGQQIIEIIKPRKYNKKNYEVTGNEQSEQS